MIISPMIRNNICLNAHPVGCKHHVAQQIQYIQQQPRFSGPQKVLIIGSATGYGLASRLVSMYAANAQTLGVSFERPGEGRRTGSAGWYAIQAVDAPTIVGDAFSHEIKEETIARITQEMGTVDLVVYSLASGIRIDPDTGQRYTSVLKPIGDSYQFRTVDIYGNMKDGTVDAASEEEIEATIKVMGGEDWFLWMEKMADAGVLAPGVISLSYSYIGPELTRPLYRDGTIGRAKENLEATVNRINKKLASLSGRAYVSVNKALVTRASAVIPSVPLYLSILYRIMKDEGLHEGCIEQIYRLFHTKLYHGGAAPVDSKGRIRMDDWEMKPAIQQKITEMWDTITPDTIHTLTDINGVKDEFLQLNGFGYSDIDYQQDVPV